jgi:hypothetical protein
MVANVLRAEKHSPREGLEKDPWLNQTRDWFQSKPAERLDLATDFVQLRNAIRIEVQLPETIEILGTRVSAMSWSKRVPDCLPDVVFEFRVGRVWDWLAGPVAHRDVGNSIAAGAIFAIAKTGMVGVKINDPHINVVR